MSYCVNEVAAEKGLKMMHLNSRSFFKKRHQCFKLFDEFDIVCISESWLHEGYNECLLQWPGKTIYRLDRPSGTCKKTGGGIVCYVSDYLASYCLVVPQLGRASREPMFLNESFNKTKRGP